MVKVRSWAGLDVHARSVLAVTLDGESGELRSCRLPGETAKVVESLAKLPGPTRAAYEAGPTGYGLARALHAAGIGHFHGRWRSAPCVRAGRRSAEASGQRAGSRSDSGRALSPRRCASASNMSAVSAIRTLVR